MKKLVKKCVWTLILGVIVCLALMVTCNHIVTSNAKGKAFSNIDSIKKNRVGVLLGTTPQARLTKVTNYFFIYRIDAAEQLYKAGKIEKILISGDENSLDGIAVPNVENIEDYIKVLDRNGYFEVTNFTSEDLSKVESNKLVNRIKYSLYFQNLILYYSEILKKMNQF